ncbi:unnamed protein product, partial [Brassica rapa subsp. trilocularis]
MQFLAHIYTYYDKETSDSDICLLPHVSPATALMVRKQLLTRSPVVMTSSHTPLGYGMQQPLLSSPLLVEAMQRNIWFQQEETH